MLSIHLVSSFFKYISTDERWILLLIYNLNFLFVLLKRKNRALGSK